VGACGCSWNVDFRGGRTPNRHFNPRKELGSRPPFSKLILAHSDVKPLWMPTSDGKLLVRVDIGKRR